jgi:predicted PurR-regulated permease PerM
MAYLYFTVAAIFLYFFSDWILNLIEQRLGKRLKYRSVVFFVIIAVLAIGSFEMIDRIVGEPPQITTAPKDVK